MAVACFSLIGLPLTVGFFGKVQLILPALNVRTTSMYWLVAIMMINAAISAGYYLRIVASMFLRPASERRAYETSSAPVIAAPIRSLPVTIAIALSVAGTLLFGIVPPAAQVLTTQALQAQIDDSGSTSNQSLAQSQDR
jgi:NADH-quinone oxidoreductase subunit N